MTAEMKISNGFFSEYHSDIDETEYIHMGFEYHNIT